MNRLTSNHLIYFIGLLISVVGATLLGIAIAGDMLPQIISTNQLLAGVHSITAVHIVEFVVSSLLITVFLFSVHIYNTRIDLLTDIMTFFGGGLIVVASCLFAVVEGVGGSVDATNPLVLRETMNLVVLAQLLGWISFCLILVDFIIGLVLYISTREEHEVHSATEELNGFWNTLRRIGAFLWNLLLHRIGGWFGKGLSSIKATRDENRRYRSQSRARKLSPATAGSNDEE